MNDRRSGLNLYVKRVFIMNDCDSLLPRHLDFIKGVVDSSDLPLNVSREMLQEDRLLARIRKNLVKKILSTLKEMKDKDYDSYLTFWNNFGAMLRAGIPYDFENQEKLGELLLYPALKTERDKFISLDQYVESMDEGQEDIFYMIAETREMVEHSPYVERFKEMGHDVLIMTEPVDEIIVQSMQNFKGKTLKAIDRGEIDAKDDKDEAKEEQVKEYSNLLGYLKENLEDVKDVRLSKRLKESAACLVGEEGAMGVQMERLMKEMGQDAPAQQRILELNPDHPVVEAMVKLHGKDSSDSRIVDYGCLLYDQAALAAGVKIKDPAAMARRINSILERDVGG